MASEMKTRKTEREVTITLSVDRLVLYLFRFIVALILIFR